MNKHKKGFIFEIMGLVIIFAAVSLLFFPVISDQIPFKHVESDIKIKKLNVTLDDVAKKRMNNYTSQQVSNKKNDAWRDASITEIKGTMDSDTFIDDEKQKYQFLDLSKYQGIDKNRVKRMLVGRPTLLKRTDGLLKAAKDKHVNEAYSISHALLGTGAIRSELANGVEIGGKEYYNFYGVGALDRDPIKTGAEYAKKHGWGALEKAISGSANPIHKHFLSSTDQSTLYSTRWDSKSSGEHQYATDIKWAESNVTIIADFHKNMKIEGKYFKYFVYKGDGKHLNK